jgi:hypothetical protein
MHNYFDSGTRELSYNKFSVRGLNFFKGGGYPDDDDCKNNRKYSIKNWQT